MPFRFRRSIRLTRGVRLNFSRSGASVSTKIGPLTVNSRGRASVRLARGLSYQTGSRAGASLSGHSRSSAPAQAPLPRNARVDFWFAALGGWLGLHRFYRGQIILGTVYLFTGGLLLIGWVADAVLAYRRMRAVAAPTAV